MCLWAYPIAFSHTSMTSSALEISETVMLPNSGGRVSIITAMEPAWTTLAAEQHGSSPGNASSSEPVRTKRSSSQQFRRLEMPASSLLQVVEQT